jgi:hypothetical protein
MVAPIVWTRLTWESGIRRDRSTGGYPGNTLLGHRPPVVPIAKFEQMNADLAKAGVYNKSMQKQLTAWYGRRNDAAHGIGANNTEADVTAIIDGVRRFVADYLN